MDIEVDSMFFASLVESPTQMIEPLLNSYNDYEDSVYGNWYRQWVFLSALIWNQLSFHLNLTLFRSCLEFPGTMGICIIILWWKGKCLIFYSMLTYPNHFVLDCKRFLTIYNLIFLQRFFSFKYLDLRTLNIWIGTPQ